MTGCIVKLRGLDSIELNDWGAERNARGEVNHSDGYVQLKPGKQSRAMGFIFYRHISGFIVVIVITPW